METIDFRMNNPRNVDFHGVTFSFHAGNIATFDADTAVVSSDPQFSMRNGAARAISDRGGLPFRAAFEVALATNDRDYLVIDVSEIDTLSFTNIIVIPVRARHRNSMRVIYRMALKAAIDNGHERVVMPLIGCGGFHISVHQGCRDLKEAVSTFSQFGPIRDICFIDTSSGTTDELAQMFESLDDLPNILGASQDPGALPVVNDDGIEFLRNIPGPSVQNEIAFDGPPPAPIGFNPIVEVVDVVAPRPDREDDTPKYWKVVDRTEFPTAGTSSDESLANPCPICLCDLATSSLGKSDPADLESDPVVKLVDCIHMFHLTCITQCFENKKQCPMCMRQYENTVGSQPAHGKMTVRNVPGRVPGHPRAAGWLRIKYSIPIGIQTPRHIRPGVPHAGTTRTAWLPDDEGGREVLGLLRRAFDQRHIFTIGDSITTGQKNVPVWVIHHKTSQSGGPTDFGYPDPDYYDRVKEELAQVGITSDD
uniref:E3 ubiquitin-protein ligase n=1 Tax=Panagrellus redivivus TaxID=6233 RepID=A0A7E4UUN1_PANRE